MCECLYTDHDDVSHDEIRTVVGDMLRMLGNLKLQTTMLFASLHIKENNEAKRYLILCLKATMHLMQKTFQMMSLIKCFYLLQSESLRLYSLILFKYNNIYPVRKASLSSPTSAESSSALSHCNRLSEHDVYKKLLAAAK